MPRAPKISEVDAREFALSRDFLKTSLEPVIKAKLDAHENGKWLVNPATKATYNTYTIEKPHAQTGMAKITFDTKGQPIEGMASPDLTWLVLHEPASNRVFLMHWPTVSTFMRNLMQNPQHAGGMATVVRGNGQLHLNLHLEWAIGQKLIKLATALKSKYGEWREKKLATKENFVHLHCHSEFSLLDGASAIDMVGKRALLNGQPGIALTDHGNCFGAYKHWKACADLGVKPIMGCEIYLVDDVRNKYAHDGTTRRFEYHQTIIAMNDVGWNNLCELLTAGGRDNYWYVPRVDHEMLFKHSEGLICLSGCFKGMAAHYLQHRQPREGETVMPWWLQYNPERSREMIRQYKKVFGDRYYGEVMNIDFEQYNACVPELIQMLRGEGVPIVMTNDCHYEREEDARVQAMLTRISTQKVDGMGEQMRDKGVYFIRQRSEMEAGAPWASSDMFDRTCEIMERCTLSFKRDGYLFPPYALHADPDWAAFQESKK